MASPKEWNPNREIERFRGEVEDLLDRLGPENHWTRSLGSIPFRPSIEAFVDNDRFNVRIDLPGIDPAKVDITAAGRLLTIKGSREDTVQATNPHFYRRETRYGAFERTIELPEGVKAEDLQATYSAGVLELMATMPQEPALKEIKIQGSPAIGEKSSHGTKAE